MRILLDQGTPVPLRRSLPLHEVITAFERGWHALQNGDLLAAAEAENFDVLITTDQNLRYQQNLTERRIAVIVLTTTNWPTISKKVELVVRAVGSIAPSGYLELSF